MPGLAIVTPHILVCDDIWELIMVEGKWEDVISQ
jgi:hypothetical protein